MDLKAKIEELQREHDAWEENKTQAHEKMKEIREKIRKYERVLKEAQEIESVEHEETAHN